MQNQKPLHLIVLAAGYATRLRDKLEGEDKGKPKHLLEVAGKTILDHGLERFEGILGIEKVTVVTNAVFTEKFEDWCKGYKGPFSVNILNDGTTSNEDRRGSIGDIHYCLEQESVKSDVIVFLGDNLFGQSLQDFVSFAREKNTPAIGVYDVGSLEEAKRFGCVAVDENEKITSFEEKPEKPKSSLISVGLYYFPAGHLYLVGDYIKEGKSPDLAGNLVCYLVEKNVVHAHPIQGYWEDIGDIDALKRVRKDFDNAVPGCHSISSVSSKCPQKVQ